MNYVITYINENERKAFHYLDFLEKLDLIEHHLVEVNAGSQLLETLMNTDMSDGKQLILFTHGVDDRPFISMNIDLLNALEYYQIIEAINQSSFEGPVINLSCVCESGIWLDEYKKLKGEIKEVWVSNIKTPTWEAPILMALEGFDNYVSSKGDSKHFRKINLSILKKPQ